MSEEKFGARIGKFWDNHNLELLQTVIASFGYTLSGVLFELNYTNWGWFALVICFILTIYFFFRIIKNKKSLAEVEKEKNELSTTIRQLEGELDKLYSTNLLLINEQLSVIFNELYFTNTERISVYRHDNSKNNFVLIGRHSDNPKLNEIVRKFYPDDEGFLSEALNSNDGEFYIDNIPKFKKGKADQYINCVLNNCNISEEKIRALGMKSVSYYIILLKDSRHISNQVLVVCESVKHSALKKPEIRDKISRESRRLSLMIDRIKIKDTTEIANQTGF